MASAHGYGGGESAVSAACVDGGMDERAGAEPWLVPGTGAWSAQGAGSGVAVRAGAQSRACRGFAAGQSRGSGQLRRRAQAARGRGGAAKQRPTAGADEPGSASFSDGERCLSKSPPVFGSKTTDAAFVHRLILLATDGTRSLPAGVQIVGF